MDPARRIGPCVRTSLEQPPSARSNRSRAERVLLLPSVDFLKDGFSNEVANPVEVVVTVDYSHEVLVVASLYPTRDGHLREDLLPGLRQRGRRHRCNAKAGKHL